MNITMLNVMTLIVACLSLLIVVPLTWAGIKGMREDDDENGQNEQNNV